MSAPLVERSTGDLIPAADHNDVKDYIEDATYRVNTLSLEIQGTEIITEDGYAKPVRIMAPDSGGIVFYDSAGTTQIAKLDESGNLHIKGRVISL